MLLQIENLTVAHNGSPILSGVNLQVQENEVLGIVGESGSGKSTLLYSIMGLLDSNLSQSKGSICVSGETLGELDNERMRQLRGEKMSLVFQNPGASFSPILTLKNQYHQMLKNHGRVDEGDERLLSLFAKVNLKDGERILSSYPFELSGGMNQRVALCIAMAMQPSLLLADEPTSALDVTVQAQVLLEMRQLKQETGTSIVIVSHNMGVINCLADRVAVMNAGRIVECGNKDEVFLRPKSAYTKALLAATPRLRGQRPKGEMA